MSGTKKVPERDRRLHISAARSWLDRADSQLAEGEEILAASSLMLAQAELRLYIEKAAACDTAPAPTYEHRRISFFPLSSRMVGGLAMVACLLFGFFIGNLFTTSDKSLPSETETPLISILPDPETAPASIETGNNEQPVLTSESGHEEKSAIAGVSIPEEPPAVQIPVTRKPIQTKYTPPVSSTPENEAAHSDEPSTPKPILTASTPPAELSDGAESSLNVAELSLRTIRALTERLMGDTSNEN